MRHGLGKAHDTAEVVVFESASLKKKQLSHECTVVKKKTARSLNSPSDVSLEDVLEGCEMIQSVNGRIDPLSVIKPFFQPRALFVGTVEAASLLDQAGAPATLALVRIREVCTLFLSLSLTHSRSLLSSLFLCRPLSIQLSVTRSDSALSTHMHTRSLISLSLSFFVSVSQAFFSLLCAA